MIYKIIVAVSIVAGSAVIAKEPALMNEKEFEEQLGAIEWLGVGTYKLPSSHSSLSVPAEHTAVVGADARTLSNLVGNEADSSLEAITMDEYLENSVYFLYEGEGYISLDDWEKIKPKELLEEIIKNTEKANRKRRKMGIPEIHVLGWIQEPTLDRQTNTVYWSIEHEEDDSDATVFNSVALRLGRRGYERIVWVGEMFNYKPFGGELDTMLRAHSFDQGYRYTDFTAGDKVAGYGIAALVAGTIGAKVLKAGGLAVLFKKIGGFLAAGIAAVFYKIRNIFLRKNRK